MKPNHLSHRHISTNLEVNKIIQYRALVLISIFKKKKQKNYKKLTKLLKSISNFQHLHCKWCDTKFFLSILILLFYSYHVEIFNKNLEGLELISVLLAWRKEHIAILTKKFKKKKKRKKTKRQISNKDFFHYLIN